MILRRILLALLAAAIVSAGAGVAVVALAFALYALVEPRLGRAGAAAVVAGAAAGLIFLAGFGVALAGRRPPSTTAPAVPVGMLERVLAFLSQRPVVAATTALGGAIIALRNPKYLGAALRAFLDGDTTRR